MVSLAPAGSSLRLVLAERALATPPSPTVVDRERSGTAVGVFRFCGDLGFTLGPLVAGVSASAVGFRALLPSRRSPPQLPCSSSCGAETLRVAPRSQPRPDP